MPNVRLPDGNVAAFPDTMSQEQIAAAIGKHFGRGAAEEPPTPGVAERVRNYASGSVESLKQAGRDIAKEGPSLLGDLFAAFLPTKGGAEAGGRVLSKMGDVAAFASGGFAGPNMPTGMRVTEPPRTPQQRALQDFQRLGMTPSVPAISERRPAVPFFRAARALPFSPIERGIERNIGEAGQASDRLAGQMGPAASGLDAGGAIQSATRRFAADRSQAATDYGEFYRLMHGAQPAPMTQTLKVLDDIQGRFKSAPELRGLFTNPKFEIMRKALAPGAQTDVAGILGPDEAPIVGQATQRGLLTIPEMKELHSQIGYLIEDPSFGPEAIPKAQLRRLYGAITNDLKAAAQRQSPAAAAALQRATTNYGLRMQTMERLEPLMKPDAPERSFARINAAAQSSGTADSQLLQTAKDVMQPEEWNNVGAAMVRRLGFPSGVEKADTLGPDFSLSAYARNWNKLSGRAKDLLFGEDNPSTVRNGLETLARVARNKALVPRGPGQRGSDVIGRIALEGTVIEAVLRSAATGKVPLPELGGLAGAYGLSKLMMSPKFASWLYQLPSTIRSVPGTEAIPRAEAAMRSAYAAEESPQKREREEARRAESYKANRRGDLSEVISLNNK